MVLHCRLNSLGNLARRACQILNKTYSFRSNSDPNFIGKIYYNSVGRFIYEPSKVVSECAEKEQLLVIAVNSKISNILQRNAVINLLPEL